MQMGMPEPSLRIYRDLQNADPAMNNTLPKLCLSQCFECFPKPINLAPECCLLVLDREFYLTRSVHIRNGQIDSFAVLDSPASLAPWAHSVFATEQHNSQFSAFFERQQWVAATAFYSCCSF
jgi:hypothetical protein